MPHVGRWRGANAGHARRVPCQRDAREEEQRGGARSDREKAGPERRQDREIEGPADEGAEADECGQNAARSHEACARTAGGPLPVTHSARLYSHLNLRS
jgi:hypothetical protein